MPTQTPTQTPTNTPAKKEPSRIDAEKALSNLNLSDESDLDLEEFEAELIKQTKLTEEMGPDKAKIFFRAMMGMESGGKTSAVGVNPRGVKALGRWQVSEETARDKYKLDPSNPALNAYMGVDYWNEGYNLAEEFTSDPVEKAAIATQYYHGGPKAIERMRKANGEFSKGWDGGVTTNDHVYKVLTNWKELMDKEGLDFSTVAENTIKLDDAEVGTGVGLGAALDPELFDSTFTGQAKGSDLDPSQVARPRMDTRDPRAYLVFKPTFTPQEKEQYRLGNPAQREEMIIATIARSLGGDTKKGIEALKRYRDYEPEAYAGMEEQAQIGDLGELSIGAGIPRLVAAYQSGGAKKFDEELMNVRADEAQFTLEQQSAEEIRQKELAKTSQTFRDLEQQKLAGNVDDIDIAAMGGFAGAIHSTIAGVAGAGGALAGKLGLDELDRQLSAYSLLESDKARIVQEETDLVRKKSMIPGEVLSAAQTLGALPVQIGSYAAGGIGGVYLQTLAQYANEDPLKALMLASSNAFFMGRGLAQATTKAGAMNLVAQDSILNAVQMAPEIAPHAALLLYAKQNPGKVTEKELSQAQERLDRGMEDLIGQLALGGIAGLARVAATEKGGYTNARTDAFGQELKRNPFAPWATKEQVRVERRAMDSYLETVGPEREGKIRTKGMAEIKQLAELERQGGISSVAAITSPEALETPLIDQNGEPLGKVLIGVDEIPGSEGVYLAKFTDSQGRILPPELISQDGAEIYKAKLQRVGDLTKKGASPEEITQAIIEAQPKSEELGEGKVAAILDQERMEVEAARETPETVETPAAKAFNAEKEKFDSKMKAFRKQTEELKAQLAQFKKFADEPEMITQSRKNLADAAKGEMAGSFAGLYDQAMVMGYDTYRTMKEAGLGFMEWLAEMSKNFSGILSEEEKVILLKRLNNDISGARSSARYTKRVRVGEYQVQLDKLQQDLNNLKDEDLGGPDWKAIVDKINETEATKNRMESYVIEMELKEKKYLQTEESVLNGTYRKPNQAVLPYLPDIYEKILFLDSTKTLSEVTRDPQTGEWKFAGSPTKLFHATRGMFDEEAYSRDRNNFLAKEFKILEEIEAQETLIENILLNGGTDPDKFTAEQSKLDKLREAYNKLYDTEQPIEDFYRRAFDDFSISAYGSATDIGWYGIGVYMGDLDEAHKYAHGAGVHIRPQWVNIKSPLIWDYAKDSSMQRYLQNWRTENGQVLSPEDRAPGQAWKLPKEIHDEAEMFVRGYLEEKATKVRQINSLNERFHEILGQIKSLEKQLESIETKEDISNPNVARKVELFRDGIAKLKKERNDIQSQIKDVDTRSWITESDLHQLSRGITTIMKDKGYDGVFVMEESKANYPTKAKFIEWAEKKTAEEGNPKSWDQLSDEWDYKSGDLYEAFISNQNSSYRIKEYVAFSPDQILSTYEGFTPRDINTGESLKSPQKELGRARSAELRRIRQSEAGYLDIRDFINLANDTSAHLYKLGRRLNRFFAFTGKEIRATGELTLGQQQIAWTQRLQEITAEYPSASRVEKSYLTQEKNSIQRKLVGLNKQIQKNSYNAKQGEAVANEWAARLSAGARSKLMLLDFWKRSRTEMAGIGTNLDEYFRYRQQDRLEGVRERYNSWAGMIPQMTDDDLILAFTTNSGLSLYHAVKSINEVRPGAFDEARAVMKGLEQAAESGDFTQVRKQITNIFTVAADMIPRNVFPDYDNYRANGRLDTINALYKSTIEDLLRTKFEETDSMPSQHLGADKLYFPLIAEESAATKDLPKHGIRYRRKSEYTKPKSPAAAFTTGLSDSYTTDIKKLQETFAKQIRTGDRAGLIQVLLDTGVARELLKVQDTYGKWVDDEIPEGYVKREIGGSDVKYSSKREITMPTGEVVKFAKEFSQPVKQLIVPEELDKEISLLLKTEGFTEAQLKQAIGRITAWNLVGPMDGIIHGWNVLDGLRSRLGTLPSNLFSASSRSGQAVAFLANAAISGAGKAPGPLTLGLGRSIYAFAKGMEQALLSKDTAQADRAWANLAKALDFGAVPERIGETTFSVDVANATGSRLVGPLQWKPIRSMLRQMGMEVAEPTRQVGAIEWKEGGFAERNIKGTKVENGLIELRKLINTMPLSPAVFGYGGFDLRARLATAEAIQHYAPSMSNYEVFEATTLLGVYNRFAEAELSRFLKSTQISPFYSAASSRVRRVFQAWTRPVYGARSGIMRDSREDRKKDSLGDRFIHSAATVLSESMYSYIAMWAIMHHAQTNKWPWEDEDSRFMQIRLSPEDLRSSRYLSTIAPIIAPNPNEGVYLQYASWFGGSGGGNMLGVNAAWKLMMSTSDTGATRKERLNEAFKAAMAQAATSQVHVLASGPPIHIAAKGLLGVDIAITRSPKATVGSGNVRGVQGGGFETNLLQSRGPSETAVWRDVAGALLETNGMLENFSTWADMNPAHRERFDAPFWADFMRFTIQMASKNAVKTQENPHLTRAKNTGAIIYSRKQIPVQKVK